MKRRVDGRTGCGQLPAAADHASSREFAPTRHERGGFIRDPTSLEGRVYFEIPRSAHRISFKFPLQLIYWSGTRHERGGFIRG